MEMDLLANNERKRQLLESRLVGNFKGSPPPTTSNLNGGNSNSNLSNDRAMSNTTPSSSRQAMNTDSLEIGDVVASGTSAAGYGSASNRSDTQPTCVDASFASPREIIHIDSSKSNSSRAQTAKENLPDNRSSSSASVTATATAAATRSVIGKRSFDLRDESNQSTCDGFNPPHEKVPRQQQQQSATGSPPLQLMEYNGSRGNAGGTMRNIKSYFSANGGGAGGGSGSSMMLLHDVSSEGASISSRYSKINAVTAGHEISKSASLEAISVTNPGHSISNSIGSGSNSISVSSSSQLQQQQGGKSESDAAKAQQYLTTINELRRQLEQRWVERETAELRQQHLEAEVRQLQEQCRRVEERAGRLTKALEQVHRERARQDFRTRRDKLALDCVRLGKIVPMRTVSAAVAVITFDFTCIYSTHICTVHAHELDAYTPIVSVYVYILMYAHAVTHHFTSPLLLLHVAHRGLLLSATCGRRGTC